MLERARAWAKPAAVVAAGVVLGLALSAALTSGAIAAVSLKLKGDAPDCPWAKTLSVRPDSVRFSQLFAAADKTLQPIGYDAALGIEQIASPERNFWIRRTGERMPGRTLLAYLVAEHTWMAERSGPVHVRQGDFVLDCGAHVGVFTHTALKCGAARVVAFEPEPRNLECLRRNFAAEIAAGRVVIVPKGVWSSDAQLLLHAGVQNSGSASVVADEGGESVAIELTTIDRIVAEAGLPRVDFIKMDIEGAEREALTGAMEVLKKFRPRLMLDSYHRQDDLTVLPQIVRRAHRDYNMTCGPCWTVRGALVPHVTYYE